MGDDDAVVTGETVSADFVAERLTFTIEKPNHLGTKIHQEQLESRTIFASSKRPLRGTDRAFTQFPRRA
jgi:hypothetical protein